MYMYDEIFEQPRVLRECAALNIDIIKAVICELKTRQINNVVIAARGTSDNAATYAKYCIEILTGKPVSLAAPSVITLYKSVMDYKNSLVIGISQSGMAEDVREVLECANQQGACTVCITNAKGSPLDIEAKYPLYCNAGPERSVAATKTFLSEMFIVEAIAALWEENEDIISSLLCVPDALERQLERSEEAIEAAGRYKFADKCLILARGLLYPVALEAALKLQETSYISAKAYAISDFLHGPLAIIEKNTPVILFCGNDAAKQNATAMARKLKDMGADILSFTDSNYQGLGADQTIYVPSADSFAEPFHYALAAQLFAYGMAVHKEINPDMPRNLTKVTVTK